MSYRQTDDDDELMQTASAGPITGAPVPTAGSGQAVGAPTPAAASGAPASRFVGFQQYLDANRSAADATAGRIAGEVEGLAQQAQAANQAVRDDVSQPSLISQVRDVQTPQRSGAESALYGRAATATHDAQTALDNTQTAGGLQQLIGTGSGGAGRFDAGLVGAAGRQQFGQLRSRYADLQGALDRTATYTAPASGSSTPTATAPIAGAGRDDREDREEEARRRLRERTQTRNQRHGINTLGRPY